MSVYTQRSVQRRQALLSAHCQDKSQWAQTGAREIPSEHQGHFCAVLLMEY